jgi:hypothetical protein
MTDTAVQPPAAEVDHWLSRFEEALAAGDSAAASELFADDGFRRDLVSFTWNITTVEGPAGVSDMLEHTLGHVKPRGFRTTEPPAETGGVAEAWIEFETEVGRGRGHLRLRDGKAWTSSWALSSESVVSKALWFHGGNLHQSRHYSLYLALQLKARAEGIDTPVYRMQEVHHLS